VVLASATLLACSRSKDSSASKAVAAEAPPPAEAFECSRCGQRHPWREIGFAWPDATFALSVPEAEQKALRAGKNEDALVMRDHLYFVRGWAPVPIREGGEYGLGFWLQVSRADFQDFESRKRMKHPTYQGTIANQTLLLAPSLGMKAEMYARADDQRPGLRFKDASHPLAMAQRDGVPVETVRGWMSMGFHLEDPEAKGAPFDGTLEKHGWAVLDPEEAGRTPAKLEQPPKAGKAVKVVVRFIAADEEGRATGLNAGWWVRLDDVSRPELWSGTLDNYPRVPATLTRGARLWLKPSQVVEVEPG
jgi:hypothetical protein